MLGCNAAYADIWFVQPNGDELTCSTVPTTPSDTNELTTWYLILRSAREPLLTRAVLSKRINYPAATTLY